MIKANVKNYVKVANQPFGFFQDEIAQQRYFLWLAHRQKGLDNRSSDHSFGAGGREVDPTYLWI